MWHWPTMRPPAPLKARWILPRCFVCASRISHVFFFCQDQIQPRVLHYEQKLRRTPQGAPLASQLFLPSSRGVASVARGSLGAAVASVARCSFAVAAVAWDSATATKCLSLRACKRRIRLEAGHAKFCPGGSGILPATGHAAWHLGFCRQSGARQAQDRH